MSDQLTQFDLGKAARENHSRTAIVDGVTDELLSVKDERLR